MDKPNSQLEEKLLDEIESLEDRFDRHLEIYRNNGIESKRVADALVTLLEHSLERDAKVDTMYAKHQADSIIQESDARRMKTIVLWGATIAAAGVIIALIRQVLMS